LSRRILLLSRLGTLKARDPTTTTVKHLTAHVVSRKESLRIQARGVLVMGQAAFVSRKEILSSSLAATAAHRPGSNVSRKEILSSTLVVGHLAATAAASQVSRKEILSLRARDPTTTTVKHLTAHVKERDPEPQGPGSNNGGWQGPNHP